MTATPRLHQREHRHPGSRVAAAEHRRASPSDGPQVRAHARSSIVVGTIQGAMFLLIFRYVFGGAIHIGGLPYVDFLVPGFVVTGVLFAGIGAAAGVAEDLEQGFFDRLRSLPIPRCAVLTGPGARRHAVCWPGAWSSRPRVGFAVGFRLARRLAARRSPRSACASCSASPSLAVHRASGLVAGNAQAAQGMSLLVFPLTFVSSAYVPVDDHAGWMQAVRRAPADHARWSTRCGTLRSAARAQALLGHAPGTTWCRRCCGASALVAVFGLIATARFRRS